MYTFTKYPALILLLAIAFAACEKTEIDNRRQFRGTWDVEEYSHKLGYSYYQARISLEEFSEERILIENFYGAGLEVTAIVTGSKMFIPQQTIGIFEVDGYGAFSDNYITMSYVVHTTLSENQVISDTLEAWYTKRF